jgi:hypothetical protein
MEILDIIIRALPAVIAIGLLIFIWWWTHPGPAGHIWYEQMIKK